MRAFACAELAAISKASNGPALIGKIESIAGLDNGGANLIRSR
jgi:hypothetical protein